MKNNRLSGVSSLAYMGTKASMPPNMFMFDRAPTANDYLNFSLGDFWMHRKSTTANDTDLYGLMGVAGGVADWRLISVVDGREGFAAYLASNDDNVTGNSTIYTIGTNTAFTETYDNGNNFNTNGTFTAPSAGLYHFSAGVRLLQFGGATGSQLQLNTTDGLFVLGQAVPTSSDGFFSLTGSAYVLLSAGSTAVLRIQVVGVGADTTDLSGGAQRVTFFGGQKVS